MNRNTELENMHCTATDAKLLLCAVIHRSDITTKLKKLNGRSYNYILKLANKIVYIGYSSSLCLRLHQHKYSKSFDEVIVIEMADKKAARLMERNLIKQYKPKYNYQYLR